jgi:two-component sensor histidine kinase
MPNSKMQRLQWFENAIYALILLVALGIPFYTGGFINYGWKMLLIDWIRLIPFVLIFAANNFIMVPRLLFREKYLFYFLSCFLCAGAAIIMSFNLFKLVHPEPFPFPPPNFEKPIPPGMFEEGKQMRLFFHFGAAIIAVLLIGFNTGIKSFVRWNEDRVRQAEKERQYFFTELAFLKHQISPHFFMNTLNNIHALVDIDREEAKNAIIKLSQMMRYLLYESEIQTVSLRKEIDFINSYIELMRLRYDEYNLKIETDYPESADTVSVPSSLFLSFIENAFKYGVNPRIRSVIKISLSVSPQNDLLTFNIVNSIWDMGKQIIPSFSGAGESTMQTESTGIGIENVRKRLDLIYHDKYSLDIRTTDNTYEVTLKIPVS